MKVTKPRGEKLYPSFIDVLLSMIVAFGLGLASHILWNIFIFGWRLV